MKRKNTILDKEQRYVLLIERVLDVPVGEDKVAILMMVAGSKFLRQHLQAL